MEQSQNMQNWADGVISIWMNNNVKLEIGATIADISDTENIIGLKLPAGFVEIYNRANGFVDSDMNSNMISFWSLQRIKEEYAINENQNFVGFCDYLINSHFVGFLKNSPGIFNDYDNVTPIASTFMEWVDLINNDSPLIY